MTSWDRSSWGKAMTLDIQACSKRLQELGFSAEQADGLPALQ